MFAVSPSQQIKIKHCLPCAQYLALECIRNLQQYENVVKKEKVSYC